MDLGKAIQIRKTNSARVIVFVHGFGGDGTTTFGLMPAFLASHPELVSWDISSYGYPARLAPDWSGLWPPDPDLTTLGNALAAEVVSGDFKAYDRICFIGHSMGGLVIQRAILSGGFADRIANLSLYGTPSAGLRRAKLLKFLKKQTRDMASGGVFVTALRQDWADAFSGAPPFDVLAVAGVRDTLVPTWSSVDPFPTQFRHWIEGSHTGIVKPRHADADCVRLLTTRLVSDENPRIRQSGASEHADTVERLWSGRGTLGERDLVRLALALELSGRQDDAIALLEQRRQESTELAGVLGGRLKQLWLADPEGAEAEGRRALGLYREAFDRAVAAGDHAQALYHGINTAFLVLALDDDAPEAERVAGRVLRHCENARSDQWRAATAGEAKLYLGDSKAALVHYRDALGHGPDARERQSMMRQAVWAARLTGDDVVEGQLVALYELSQ